MIEIWIYDRQTHCCTKMKYGRAAKKEKKIKGNRD